METANTLDEVLVNILPILKRGNTVEVKRVGGEIQIIEIQRKIKHRMTAATGQPDTANWGQV
jgi:hypothetical protein